MNIRKLYLTIALILGGTMALNAQSAALSQSSRTEAQLEDGEDITVTLTGAKFVREGTLTPAAFMLRDAPAGLSITSVSVKTSPADSTQAIINFITTDFDSLYSFFHFTIHDTVLLNTTDSIVSDTMSLVPRVEIAKLTSIPLPLDEHNLETGSAQLQIDIVSPEEFADDNGLVKEDFTLVNFPAGVIITGVSTKTKPRVILDIAYTPGDFDSPISNARVIINDPAHLKLSTDTLLSDTLLIRSFDESVAYVSGGTLTEHTLNAGEITIELDKDETATGDLDTADFTLINFPPGRSIESVSSTNGTTIKVKLDFDYTDFDSDYSTGQIMVESNVLKYNKLDDLLTTAGDIVIAPYIEDISAALSSDQPLTEYNLDGRKLSVVITDDWIKDVGNFDEYDFEIINKPANLTIDNVDVIDSTKFDVYLTNTYEDPEATVAIQVSFNTNILNYSTGGLSTNPIDIAAIDETPTSTMTMDSILEEYTLPARWATIVLAEEWLKDTSSFDKSNLILNDAPNGFSVDSINIKDSTEFTVYFGFVYQDFDLNKNFSISIPADSLYQSTINLKSNDLTIFAKAETPVAFISPTDSLKEYTLNDGSFTVKLIDEWIEDIGTFDTSALTLLGAPDSLFIENIVISDSSLFTVNLEFPYTDFDDDYDLSLLIDNLSLVQSGSDLESNDTTVYAKIEVPSAALTAPIALEEYKLHGKTIEVQLTDEWIKKTETLTVSDVALKDSTVGLEIASVTTYPADSSKFTITLKNTYNDFDTDSLMYIVINKDKLLQSTLSNLESDSVTITAKLEVPSAALTAPIALEEYKLHGKTIEVKLTDEWIKKTETLTVSDVALIDSTVGLEIASVTTYPADSSKFTITLKNTYNDFDADSLMYIVINKDKLLQSTLIDLESDSVTITAKVEDPSAALTAPIALEEYKLQGKTIEVKLTDEWIKKTETLLIGDLTLMGESEGLEIASVTTYPADSSKFTITLKNDYYNDFDTDSNMYLVINYNKLLQSETDDLESDSVTLTAVVENPKSILTPKTPLQEYNIDQKIITLVMEDDWIIDTNTFNKADIELVDGPAGIYINDIDILDTNTITVALNDTIIDFDGDSLLRISIDRTKLVQSISEGKDLLSDSILVIHYLENPVSTMTPSSWLREFFLDTMSLDIKFKEEVFKKHITINIDDFGIKNGPPGLTINGLSNLADSSVTLELLFESTDFDIPYTNVQVSIGHDVLIQTESDSLRTAAFTIKPNIEPVIGSISFANDTMMINDVVEVTINLAEFTADSVYTLAGGTIGGYILDSLKWISDSEYKTWFTISEGGNDYLAPAPIPISNLKLDDLPVTGVPYTSNLVQDKDLLDANKPVVKSLSIIGSGDKQIGDDVIILISAFEEDLVPEDSSEINGVPVTGSNMVYDEIGGGTYTLTYTIEPNDNNVSAGALTSKIYLRDIAGNINDVYPNIDANILSIDAAVPVITSMTNTTATDTVIIGQEVTLAVLADASGYLLTSDSEVNGRKKNEGLKFSSAGNIYYIKYTVKENDPSVAAGMLKARIILEDLAGNRSIADTVILSNDVAVLTKRPTALLTGNDEICLNDTATLYITLSGASPWRLKYHDNNDSYYIEDIQSINYTLNIDPTETLSYSIDSVWDDTGNENIGVGNSIVIVNPLPVVDILNLEAVYAVTDTNGVKLQGAPFGGNFFGPGVVTQQSFFSPPGAGLTHGIPHWIYYEYRDAKTCFNVDSQSVEIVQADVEFYWPNDPYNTACYLNQAYKLRATNIDATTGNFKIENKSYPPGFMLDNGDNTVTFNPSILDWTPGQDYEVEFTIRYDYPDKDDVPLFEKTNLVIEFFDTAYIETDLSERESCTNDVTFPLSGSRTQGKFSGSGIVDLGGFVYKFDPSLADTGAVWVMYTFESANKCVQKDSALITVYEAPTPEFEFLDSCILGSGGQISFRNISDTAGLGEILTWVWNYGDLQSGQANTHVFSTMENGYHTYPGPGRRTVTLLMADTVSENTTCSSFKSITTDLGNTPTASIKWNTECFTDEAIQFTGTSVTADGDSTFRWSLTDMSGASVKDEEGPALNVFSHQFAIRDNYSIEFTAITDKGCLASTTDTIYLRPYITNITSDAPYIENFEGEAPGWFAFADENSPQNSWKLSSVEAGKFPYDLPESGSMAWYTELVKKDTLEQSSVSSPCYDFSNMRRPMISLDRKVSSDRDRDGAVLQYTTNDGKNWINVGAVDDGSINWYNTFRIQNGPGGQGEGWTGGFIFDKSEVWKQSRHNLDILNGTPRVQFRIAYGSAGASVVQNEGFAFDNIWIGERSRVVLMEHFTNSGMALSNSANQKINQLVSHNLLDVIDLQYHAEVSGFTDKMNKDNPAPAGARSLFYGTRQVPYMLMDGGFSGQMAYDFSNNDLDTLDLYTRALADPSFKIGLLVAEQDNKLNITLDIKALEALPDKEYIVYTVIIEKLINDPAYTGAGSVSVFENVVRNMVPNAAGISLIQAWNPGDIETIPLSYEISDKILNRERIAVVAFIQDAENHDVYQVASNDPDLNGAPVIISVRDFLQARNLTMMVYPNPASGEAYLVFAEALSEKLEIQMFTHTGILVMNAQLPGGTETYKLDISGFEKGVYFIRAIQRGNVIGVQKLMIMH